MAKLGFMKRILRKSAKKRALTPGSLIHVGEQKTDAVGFSLIRYSADEFDETKPDTPDICLEPKKWLKPKGVCWLDVCGVHDPTVIEKIGEKLHIHPLVMEDILNTLHRPKQEDMDDYLFVIAKMIFFDKGSREVKSEQVSMVLRPGTLVTFQENPGDVFDPVRARIRRQKGRIRSRGADYMLYALLDAVVDGYFVTLEAIGEELEKLDNELLKHSGPETLTHIHRWKQEMLILRKAVWPLREVISSLLKSDSKLLKKSTDIYLTDLHDHIIQVIDTVETYRDVISGLQDLYLSIAGNNMNEVMKVLTIIATIFIPLTFIAGIYGMNFEFMPELKWKAGYFLVWSVMTVTAVIMMIFFKRKRWL